MRIVISPAKTMRVDTDSFEANRLPVFIEQADTLMRKIRQLSFSQAKALWNCNQKLATLNYDRFASMDIYRAQTPAVMAYEGLQYRHMAPGVLTRGALAYIDRHLRILSGFYGLLSPFDKVTPYRLEMQSRLAVGGHRDLYEFWGDRLYRQLTMEDHVILNLASKEYSRTIERYVGTDDAFITVEFGEWIDGKVKQKGTFAKMARGEMVRFLAENAITEVRDIRAFRELGFTFCPSLSSSEHYVFLRNASSGGTMSGDGF